MPTGAVKLPSAAARKPVARQRAAVNPFARVAVDVSLPHLDRPFDYLVTDAQSEAALPGVRVEVESPGATVLVRIV